jgi:preprotein translocase subunit YajC
VAVDYRDRRFASDIVTGQAVTPLDIPISIYELTEDPSVITIAGLVSQITAVADGAQIVESFNIHNDSDRLYTTSNQLGDKQYASLVFSLPPASTFIGEPNGSQRFRVTEDQTTVVDTVPVPPGVDHIVQFVFLLPYQGDAIIDQPVNYKLNGAVRLLLQPDTLEIISNSLESLGPQTVGQKTYKGYGGTLSLAADDSLTFELRGEAAAEAAELQPPATVSPTTLVLLVIVIVLLLGLLASWFFYRRQHLRPSKTARMDALLRQISELDAAHERGEINHDLYQRQRQDLKAELATYMQEDHEQPAD